MEKPTNHRIAISLIVAIFGAALLYLARNGIVPLLSERGFLMASTTCAMVMIGGGIGNVLRHPIIGGLVGVGLYAAYIAHCAMNSCLPNQ